MTSQETKLGRTDTCSHHRSEIWNFFVFKIEFFFFFFFLGFEFNCSPLDVIIDFIHLKGFLYGF